MWFDAVVIIGIGLCSSLFSEFLNWALIYRSEQYQKLKATIERLTKKLEKIKTETMDAKAKEKQTNKTEEALKAANRDMSMSKFKSMFATSLSMIILYNIISSAYSGIIVVKLPFTPFGLFQAMTHRNLPGTDYTDGSFIFVYVLSSMAFRPHLQKIFGFTPPKTLPGGGFFEMPKEN
eukprot:TRINITY_DN1964_c0_g1_i1.p1 TRINITY_DN1964_c0_g1~~TRINITY_DN1964_c0_g1_i1.p1  ORF type:complete len:178 (+),score=32.62 TRINITY_DN1964_c0_g1_i1:264-797(+)